MTKTSKVIVRVLILAVISTMIVFREVVGAFLNKFNPETSFAYLGLVLCILGLIWAQTTEH